MPAPAMATALSWIAERIRRTIPTLEPHLVRPQLPKVHKEARLQCHPPCRVGIHPHHPTTHLRVKLVIPATIERIGEVDAPSVAAHFHHLRPPLHHPTCGMRRGIDQTTNTHRTREFWVKGVRDVILAQLPSPPARHVQEPII